MGTTSTITTTKKPVFCKDETQEQREFTYWMSDDADPILDFSLKLDQSADPTKALKYAVGDLSLPYSDPLVISSNINRKFTYSIEVTVEGVDIITLAVSGSSQKASVDTPKDQVTVFLTGAE